MLSGVPEMRALHEDRVARDGELEAVKGAEALYADRARRGGLS